MGSIPALDYSRRAEDDFSPVTDDPDNWRWADSDGVISHVGEWELLSSLSTGALPPYTLVWKEGWAGWLPACQVAALSGSLDADAVEKPVEPELDPTRREPPEPPLERYHVYRSRDAAKLLGGGGKKRSITPPPPPKGGMIQVAPVPPVRRPPMPTFVDAPAQQNTTATLRPPAAVPPPPRAVPQRTSNPGTAPAEAEQPTRPRPMDTPVPPPNLGGAPVVMPPTPPLPVITDPNAPATLPTMALIGAGALLVGAVAVIAGIVALHGFSRGSDSSTATGPTLDGGAAATRTVPCTLMRPAKRLAAPIHLAVTPNITGAGEQAAVGYARTARDARGILVNLTDLSTTEQFSESAESNISGVVPLSSGGGVRFVIDADEAEVKAPRTVDASPPFTLGTTGQDVVRVASGQQHTIWPGGGGARMTDPRVAFAPGIGHAVTYRQGGQQGKLRVGWLNPDGSKRSELWTVEVSASHLGTPLVATNDEATLVAFAARATPDSFWRVQLAHGTLGNEVGPAAGFRIPPGGPGSEAISPAATGLSGGRWLLQWTEGSTGNRQVRLQTLARDLIPVGDAIGVSPEGANAGQGVVWVRGTTSLSLFLVQSGKSHELWGALLSCP